MEFFVLLLAALLNPFTDWQLVEPSSFMYVFSVLDNQIKLLTSCRVQIVQVSEAKGTRAFVTPTGVIKRMRRNGNSLF